VTAFVRLTLEGDAYYFVVDTGAASTLLDGASRAETGVA